MFAWLFVDEKDPYADAVVAMLPDPEMLVPRLRHLEVANVFWSLPRGGSIARRLTLSSGCRT
jgi:hypothetical protein